MATDKVIGFITVMSVYLWRTTPAFSLSALEKLSVLEGSCVIIPCSFSPFSTTKSMEVLLKRSSSISMLKRTVFTNQRREAIHPDYRNRVSFRGNLSSGDCSISISSIKKEDQNTYELQLREPGQRSPDVPTKININVTNTPDPPVLTDPGPVKEGQLVMVNCSVRLSCPTDRPGLKWRWERGEPNGSSVHGDTELQHGPGLLAVLRSTLTFTVPQHTNPRVRCETIYPRNRRSSAVREILVHFPPRDVSIQVHTVSVQVGGTAFLACTCKADPPVSEYQWTCVQSGITVILPKRAPTVRIYNVTRDTGIQCTVANRLGQAKSRLTALNVQYAPVILSNSSCEWVGSLLLCTCAVDSNPRPAVTWSVNSSHLPDSYNVSFSYSNSILTATLRGISDPGLPVECYATNLLGNDSRKLFQGQTGHLLWTLIPSASAVLLFLCLLMFFCWLKTNRQRRIRTYRPPAIHPEDLGIYQEHMPLYVNCSDVTHIYTNGSYQLIYQNGTPFFVRNTQTHKRQRRQARRQRVHKEIVIPAAAAEGIYVEVI
ncbi:B-cell receptor CD22 [Paramisgurnus dabryanus]|uniref:B-cell receptor CD22 n=1 Tax=Paramisgurnus dabryanus TaxID=90735 RepID=UPI0031F36B89